MMYEKQSSLIEQLEEYNAVVSKNHAQLYVNALMEVEKVFVSNHEKFAPNLKVERVKVECVANKIRFNRMNRRVKLMSKL